MTNPKLSIVIPTYNRAQRLACALENYTKNRRSDIEFIVSDNASTDATPEVVAEFQARDQRIRSLRHGRNLGPNRNVFYAFLEVRADYFMILSDDDLVTDGFIDEVIACVLAYPEAGVVCHARRTEVSPGLYVKDFNCPRDVIRYDPGASALCAVYARSSSVSGITYKATKIDIDDWRLDRSIYPQVRLACMLAVERPVIYFSSSESTLVPNHGDTISQVARNRPADMGVHERIEIAIDAVNKLPRRKRYSTLQNLLKPIRDWSAHLFVRTYQEDRRLAFTYLTALVRHPAMGTSARFWSKLLKGTAREISPTAKVRIIGLMGLCLLKSLLSFGFYLKILSTALGVNNIIKRITTRRFAQRIRDKVAACFGRAAKKKPNHTWRDEYILETSNNDSLPQDESHRDAA